MLWLYDIPTMQLAGLFALVFVGTTWLGIIFIHPLFRKLLRGQAELNNLVGVVLASHCAFFGLLLGLLAVAAYQNLSDIDKSATKEAEYLHAIYRSVCRLSGADAFKGASAHPRLHTLHHRGCLACAAPRRRSARGRGADEHARHRALQF